MTTPTIVIDDITGEQIEATGRYLFLANLRGTDSAGGHVGLSEVQVYGRQVGTQNLVFRQGDGLADQTVIFEGPLYDLNAALAGITYQGNLNYNSGMADDPALMMDPATMTDADRDALVEDRLS